MNGNNITEQQAQKEREKFVTAFNDTMIKIWQEQITLLGVIDTGALLASPKAIAMRETPRGNSGDIGRTKVRQRRKWFSRKYYASVMNIKEFYEDNIGKAFTGTLMRLNHSYGNGH